MLHSMTSFGQSVLESDWGEMSCEIRSVNHRYLDVGVRLPENLRALDARIREMMSSCVHRGKIDVAFKLSESAVGTQKLVVNEDMLQQLDDALKKVQALSPDAVQFNAIGLLQWPGVVSAQSTFSSELDDVAIETFELALNDFSSTRAREGMLIAAMLSGRATQLDQLIVELRKHRPSVVSRQREKLMAKLAQLDIEHDEARLEQELVYSAQRLDIDEELDRMKAHLHELSLVLERNDPVGRRLDFLMQEFNREANTIASKASDGATTAASIDMKVLIEQIREQVQNVE